MNEVTKEAINIVADKAQSELMLFLVLLVVAMVIVMLPLYRMIIRDRKEMKIQENEAKSATHEQNIKREEIIVGVIKENTQVIAELKATLETAGVSTSNSFSRIHDRLDIITTNEERILTGIAEIKTILRIQGVGTNEC